MQYYIVRSSDYLEHHGILGMKWGVRRYQNPDGSLTPEGMEHYGRKMGKALSSGDFNKYNNIRTKVVEGISNEQREELSKKAIRGSRDGEYKSWYVKGNPILSPINARDAAIGQYVDERKTPEQLQKEKKEREEAIALQQKIKDADLLSPWNNMYDQKAIERSNKAAELGLKAFNKLGRDYGDGNPNDADTQWWFLFEDQTIGLATIADLVNRGKTKNEIKDLISTSSKVASVLSDRDMLPGVFELNENSSSRTGDELQPYIEEYIDACIDIANEEKLKHSSILNKKLSEIF